MVESDETIQNILGKKLFFFLHILGLVLAGLLISFFTGRETDFSDASVTGSLTSSVYPSREGYKIHCSEIDYQECIESLKSKENNKNILWLSNSQLHAVNQLKEGETNAVGVLSDRLKDKKSNLIAISQPNANFQEHLVMFEFIESKVSIDTLIISLIFDDLRENGLRAGISSFLDDKETYNRMMVSEIGQNLISSKSRSSNQDHDNAGLSNTFQEKAEESFNNILNSNFPAWEARAEIRGYIFLDLLYKLRNYVFNISPSSKRKMIPEHYERNLIALREIFESAKNRNISVIAYISPFPQEEVNPYDENQYRAFKNATQSMGNVNGIGVYNLEQIVPGNMWGFKGGTSFGTETERDFMHFQYSGHDILATSLFKILLERELVEN